MKDFKTLETTYLANEEVKRLRAEFSKLCQKHPQLVECEANFKLLMEYFQGNDPNNLLLFDYLSGEFAIQNDPDLNKKLVWRTEAQIEKEKQDAIDAEKARLQNMTITDLRKAAKEEARKFAESKGVVPAVVIPAEITRQAFLAASPAQARKWSNQYGHKNLDAHWAQQDEAARYA